jgi:hypothetical protein
MSSPPRIPLRPRHAEKIFLTSAKNACPNHPSRLERKVNMMPALPLREPPIPPPATAPQGAGCEAVAAALSRLLWLAVYVTVMRLLGYRFRRQRGPRAPAATRAYTALPTPPAAPAKPRRQHLYLDRQMFLSVLASINTTVRAANAAAADAAPPPSAPAPPAAQTPPKAKPARPPHATPVARTLTPAAPAPLPTPCATSPPRGPPRPNTPPAAPVDSRPFRCDIVTNSKAGARPQRSPLRDKGRAEPLALSPEPVPHSRPPQGPRR